PADAGTGGASGRVDESGDLDPLRAGPASRLRGRAPGPDRVGAARGSGVRRMSERVSDSVSMPAPAEDETATLGADSAPVLAGGEVALEDARRCPWAVSALAIPYHDQEWGVPAHDERVLFEFLVLEGAQAGLSW